MEGKSVEKCGGGDLWLGGEGFARPLGGDLKMNQKSILDNLAGALAAFGGQDPKDTRATRTFRPSWGYLGPVLAASWSRLGSWITVFDHLGPSRIHLDPS